MKALQTLGKRLHQARLATGLSIELVARQTALKPEYIESIEDDSVEPTADQARDLVQLYGVSLDDMAGIHETRLFLEGLGKRLRAARARRDLSVEEVVCRAGISRDRLEAFESGRAEPDADEAADLALLYQISLDELAGRGWELEERGSAGSISSQSNARGTDDTESRWSRRRYGLLVVCFAMVLLAGIGIGRATLWPGPPRHSSRTLPYVTAIQILVDSEENTERREPSAVTVYRGVRNVIKVLQRERSLGGSPGEEARKSLAYLLTVLEGQRAFGVDELNEVLGIRTDYRALIKFLEQKEATIANKLEQMAALVDQAELGILALKRIRAADAGRQLDATVAGSLRNVGRLLGH